MEFNQDKLDEFVVNNKEMLEMFCQSMKDCLVTSMGNGDVEEYYNGHMNALIQAEDHIKGFTDIYIELKEGD